METQNKAKYIIYALHRDDSNSVYVGKSTSGLKRPIAHAYPSRMKNNHHLPLYRWIARHNGKYDVSILEECDKNSLSDAEMFHIEYFKSIGMKLLNCTKGGEGMHGWHPTDEQRKRSSESQKGRKVSPETKNKISQSMTGRTLSESHKKNLSLTSSGRPKTVKHCANISSSHIGKRQSDTTRNVISETVRQKVISPETRAKGLQTRKLRGRGKIPDTMLMLGSKGLYEWRTAVGLRQSDIASFVGLSRMTVSRFERSGK